MPVLVLEEEEEGGEERRGWTLLFVAKHAGLVPDSVEVKSWALPSAAAAAVQTALAPTAPTAPTVPTVRRGLLARRGHRTQRLPVPRPTRIVVSANKTTGFR